MPDPPYGEIADLLKAGQVVPFLGAGVNLGARPPGEIWNERVGSYLPTGSELSRFLAGKSNFPSAEQHDLTDLSKVASYFVETAARRRLRERLHEVFDHDFLPCEIHSYLAQIPSPLLIVTTNYDDLAERAFANAGHDYDLVVHPTDRKDLDASVLWWKHGANEPVAVHPNKLLIDLKTTTVIYKMHGTVDRLLRKYDSCAGSLYASLPQPPFLISWVWVARLESSRGAEKFEDCAPGGGQVRDGRGRG